MLRVVIQISMLLAIPLMALCLYIWPQYAPWYIAYVVIFNMLVGPVFSAGSVTGERERQTLDLLLTTTISPWQILWGKLLAGLRVSSVLTMFLMWPLLLACAMVDSSDANIYYNTELRTPAFDFSGYDTVALNFKANYQDDYKDWDNFTDQRDRFEVGVSTDGGATWETVLNWEVMYHQSHGAFRDTPGADVQINLTDEIAGQSNVMIRFHYYTSATNDAQDLYVPHSIFCHLCSVSSPLPLPRV